MSEDELMIRPEASNLPERVSKEEGVAVFVSSLKSGLEDQELQAKLKERGGACTVLQRMGPQGWESGPSYVAQLLPDKKVRIGTFHESSGWMDRPNGEKDLDTYILDAQTGALTNEKTGAALEADVETHGQVSKLDLTSGGTKSTIEKNIKGFKLGVEIRTDDETIERQTAIEKALIGHIEDPNVEAALQNAYDQWGRLTHASNPSDFRATVYRDIEYWSPDVLRHFRIDLMPGKRVGMGFSDKDWRKSANKVYQVVEEADGKHLVTSQGSRFQYDSDFYWELHSLRRYENIAKEPEKIDLSTEDLTRKIGENVQRFVSLANRPGS